MKLLNFVILSELLKCLCGSSWFQEQELCSARTFFYQMGPVSQKNKHFPVTLPATLNLAIFSILSHMNSVVVIATLDTQRLIWFIADAILQRGCCCPPPQLTCLFCQSCYNSSKYRKFFQVLMRYDLSEYLLVLLLISE